MGVGGTSPSLSWYTHDLLALHSLAAGGLVARHDEVFVYLLSMSDSTRCSLTTPLLAHSLAGGGGVGDSAAGPAGEKLRFMHAVLFSFDTSLPGTRCHIHMCRAQRFLSTRASAQPVHSSAPFSSHMKFALVIAVARAMPLVRRRTQPHQLLLWRQPHIENSLTEYRQSLCTAYRCLS
jgi:hypothetical protein